MFFLFVLFCTLIFNGAKLRIKNEETTIIKEKISICSRINKKSKRIDRIFLINLLLLPYLRKLSIYNKVRARKITIMMNDDVQLYNLPTTMGKFTHNDEHLCPLLWAKMPKAMGRYDQCTLLRLNNNDRR